VPIPLFEKLSDKFLPGSCKTGSGIRFGSNRFFRTPRRSRTDHLRQFFPVASSSKCGSVRIDSENQTPDAIESLVTQRLPDAWRISRSRRFDRLRPEMNSQIAGFHRFGSYSLASIS
jgi:hypothetical protein